MLFRNKRDRRNKNNKSVAAEGGQGVARSSKTGGFEVRQDLDMICDDSSVESDSLPTNSNVTIFNTNESRSSLTKSSATTVSTFRNHTATSASASVSQNSRDDCSWARRDDDRNSRRTSASSQKRRSRDASCADSVATPQLQGCCNLSTPSFPTLSRDNWPKTSASIPLTPINDRDFDFFRSFELANPFASSPSKPPTPTPLRQVTPTAVNLSERSKGPIDLDADDISYDSSIDSDLGDRIVISDSKLMESSSPGSLRLTPDALQRHQRRVVLASPEPKKEPPQKGYDSWKTRRDEQKWIEEQHQARDEELVDQTWKLHRQQRERAPTSTTIGSSEGSWVGRPRLGSDARKWSLGEISQNSWSSHLLGEDLEEEEDECNQPFPLKPRPTLKSVAANVSKSTLSSRRLLAGDDRLSRGSVEEPLLASDASRQSTLGSSNKSRDSKGRDSKSSSAVHRPRKVLQPEPTVPRTNARAVTPEAVKAAKKKQTMLPHLGLRALFAAEDDLADLSLAPLNCLEDLPVPPSQVKPLHQNTGPIQLLGVLRNLVPHNIVGTSSKKSTAQLAADLLEKERKRELESRLAQRRAEEEEKERIQQLKMAELERQRKREAQARMERQGQRPQPPKVPKPAGENDAKLTVKQLMIFPEDHLDHTGQDVSTITTATSTMAPCVVCQSGQRTHIAMPCMHYSFCEACVSQMRIKSVERCPVCSTKGIVFSRVLT